FSPRLSMETLAPILFMAAAARMASTTSLPATKRVEMRWPRRERSATARSDRLSESAINVALSIVRLIARLIFADPIVASWDCQRLSLALQYFLSQTRRVWAGLKISCPLHIALGRV